MNAFLKSKSSYRNLISFRKAECIYDITYYFINANLEFKDRTRDQMLQAARSGKQNIVEGCSAASTSSKTEIRLINVAKASLKELLEDYEDYETMRRLGREHNDAAYFMNLIETRPPETIANMAIILINQADYLLFKQLERLSSDFISNGGFSERMSALRRKNRGY